MKLSEHALDIAQKRYFMEGESWEDCCRRVGGVISQNESNPSKWSDLFSEIIYNGDFIPGGRIMRNAGRARGSLFNCYVVSLRDSIRSIGEAKRDALILWASGGGVGINFSPLRPKGTVIKGKGGRSSGLVSFMRSFDGDATTIESGGQRRAAAIAIVDVRHPEVEDFIDAKLVDKTLTNFNISVAVGEDFLEAVDRDLEWELSFEGVVYKKVRAITLWNKIIENMVSYAEPGLINWNNMIKNNSWYFAPIVGCNPCGEVPLDSRSCCDLGSITLPNFIANTQTNWKKMGECIETAVRMLDNVIDVNRYELREIEENQKASRRIGLGIMGLADYLFKKQVRYGSDKSIIEIEKLFKFIRDKTYESSIKLSLEKGTFPKYDRVFYNKSSFIRKLPASLRMDIKDKGIRNCTVLAVAPTGTISLLPEVSSGIEPLFSKAYKANDRVGKRIYVHKLYKSILEKEEEAPDWFVDSYDITPAEHLEVQATVQRFVCGAVSKTINLPKEATAKDLDKLLKEFIYDVKGVTVYRDGCKGEQPLNRLTEKEARKYLKEASTSQSEESVTCAKGTCEI